MQKKPPGGSSVCKSPQTCNVPAALGRANCYHSNIVILILNGKYKYNWDLIFPAVAHSEIKRGEIWDAVVVLWSQFASMCDDGNDFNSTWNQEAAL